MDCSSRVPLTCRYDHPLLTNVTEEHQARWKENTYPILCSSDFSSGTIVTQLIAQPLFVQPLENAAPGHGDWLHSKGGMRGESQSFRGPILKNNNIRTPWLSIRGSCIESFKRQRQLGNLCNNEHWLAQHLEDWTGQPATLGFREVALSIWARVVRLWPNVAGCPVQSSTGSCRITLVSSCVLLQST